MSTAPTLTICWITGLLTGNSLIKSSFQMISHGCLHQVPPVFICAKPLSPSIGYKGEKRWTYHFLVQKNKEAAESTVEE